jgi:hypothetical protein
VRPIPCATCSAALVEHHERTNMGSGGEGTGSTCAMLPNVTVLAFVVVNTLHFATSARYLFTTVPCVILVHFPAYIDLLLYSKPPILYTPIPRHPFCLLRRDRDSLLVPWVPIRQIYSLIWSTCGESTHTHIAQNIASIESIPSRLLLAPFWYRTGSA